MTLTPKLIRQLLDFAPDATVIVDAGGRIIFANAQTLNVLGYPSEELIGRPVEVLLPERYRHGHPLLRQGYIDNPRARPMGEGLELWALRKDGREIPVEISLSPIDTGNETIVCGAIRDVTERYRIQEQLKAAKSEAERANKAKSIFLAAASHDLRQPLQTLNMLNGVLRRVVRAANAAKMIDDQTEALNSISNMLDSLLDISKLEAGVIVPDVRDHSVQQIFQDLRKQFAGLAENKGIKFIVNDCHEVIHSDPGLLMHILSNLVSNAIRYTDKGLVKISCIHDNVCVGIQVLDTGVGIPAEEKQAIFEEFYQINPRLTHREGFGLGLAVVRRMVDLLGHRLELDSHPGEGSCFSVFIPLGEPSAGEETPLPGGKQYEVERNVILLIDDSLSVLDATRTLLEIEGYTVLAAGSREDAVNLIRDGDRMPDIIICDYHIPGVENGISLVGELRDLSGRHFPVIFSTGDTSLAVRENLKGLPGCRLLNKPMNVDLLLEMIKTSIHEPQYH